MGKLMIGKVAFTPKGLFDPLKANGYDHLDVVSDGYASYCSLKDNNRYPLSDSTAWMPLAGIDPDEIQSSVDTWLHAHPEATTTVQDGSITAEKLAANSVTASKLAANSVMASKIMDGNVITDKLANNCVTTAKLAANSVTLEKLADGVVELDGSQGMRKVILRKDLPFATQLQYENTIYVIQYDYDLNDPDGENPITIPDGCVLKFDGGSISGGTIALNNSVVYSDKKCFGDNVSFAGKLGNSEVKLSWFYEGNNNEDAADILTKLIALDVPAVFLDLPNVYISHPVELTDVNVTRYIIRKRIYGLDGLLRNNTMTTIKPTNNYDATGYERNAAFFFNIIDVNSTIGTGFSKLRFEGSYKFGYGIYLKSVFTEEISNCQFENIAISAIKISACENCTIAYNSVAYCGAFLLAYPNGVNENNVLDRNVQDDTSMPINMLYVHNNYIGEINYGIVASIGSNATIEKNCISYTSCQALYIFCDRILNINNNYFEGCGGGNFWIDYDGLSGDVDGNALCSHLQNTHDGEINNMTGWGLQGYSSSQIRSFIFVISTEGKLKCNIFGNNFSGNRCRTNINSYLYRNTTVNNVGVDAIFAFWGVTADIGEQHVGRPGSVNFSGIPKYYIVVNVRPGVANGSYSQYRKSKVTVSHLPNAYDDSKAWYFNNFCGCNENDRVSVILKDKSLINYNGNAKAAIFGGKTPVPVYQILPFNQVKDGIIYRSVPTVDGRGKFSFVYQGLNIRSNTTNVVNSETFMYDVYLYNPTNSDVTFKMSGKFQDADGEDFIINNTWTYFPRYYINGDATTGITLHSKEVIKLTFELNLEAIYCLTTSQYMKKLYVDFDFESPSALVSDAYGYSVNTTPSLEPALMDGMDRFGRPCKGATADRPTAYLTSYDTGMEYFDIDLGHPIYWNGTAWVDATGSAV